MNLSGHYVEWALCAYLNSTLGLLSVLGGCTGSARLNRPRMTAANLCNLAVPDFSALSPESIVSMAGAFESLGTQELLPLEDMDRCPVRKALDAVVSTALSIDQESGKHT